MCLSVLFQVTPPSGPETPLVVEVPHAGLLLDPESLALSTAPARSIGQDADLYVNELFQDAPELGASLLVSHASRYLVDLNRQETDLDPHTTPDGPLPSAPHGVIWRRTTSGRPALANPLDRTEVERRLALLYRPYHQALVRLLDEKREKFGFSILLCAHSMPSFGRLGERRADVVPGSRAKTTSALGYLTAIENTCGEFGFDYAHDAPYRGGFTTFHHGRPTDGSHAVQVELSRRLYMDETTLARRPGDFERTRGFCRATMAALAERRP